MILRFICVKSSDGSFYKVDMNQCDYLTDEFIINNTEYQSIFRCILLCNSATLNPEFSSLRRDTNTANQEYYLCTNQDDEALLVGLLPRDIKISSVKGNSIGLVYKCYSEVFYRTDRGIDPDAQHFFQIKVFCDQFKNFYAFIKGAPERVIEFIKRSTLPKNYDAEIKKMNIQCYRLLTLGHAHFDHLPSKEELLSVNTYEFLGMTAVEDKLSPQVCETIRDLQKANIKISIITGDNHNTAHNVAKKCGIICEDSDSCAFRPHYGYFDLEQVKILDKNEYGILDSEMTKQALKNPKIFYSKIKNCKAMIFCRASAVTKSNIVEFYKNTQDLKVLAIGDGFNDISMIKNAHLGIGLAGKEGKMAYNSSDIAINSFRDLSRLIIVHGHKWYEGMFQGTMLLFFKTIFYGFIMLLFCISSHFELVMVFESLSLVLYNGPIMILPILTLYTCNQSISDDDLESYPSLYYEQTYSNTKYSKLILKWVTNALLQASLTFLILQIFLFQSKNIHN
ncbi:MAG: aminophospholipid translocase [Marteilia pararefringens]